MNHLSVYTDLLLESKKFPDLDSKEAEKELHNYFLLKVGTYLDIQLIKNVIDPGMAPKPSQLIPHLIRRGYSPKFIANLLNTTTSNVSYHKQHPSKKHYENLVLLYHIDGVHKIRKNRRVLYKPVYDPNEII